ncbi:class A beta-lactamase [Aurantiacibacter aquimixticola]|uniref:beta-lactamase n=1 Tax=Aurantiacibacter aquimixticola TaxID=1958945 RepID=A0A419RRF2_9SPHN|nr:class A beta-lactamase [Aurantiacibacter aquimixticola]RJY08368.1 serine hydrolase [Aurantiacibacter aquimixticola]
MHVIRAFIPFTALTLAACDTGEVPPPPETTEQADDVPDEVVEAEAEAQADPAVSEARDALAAEIDRLALDFGGSVGLAVVDVQTGWHTGYEADQLFPQQSVSKTWVTLTALDQIDKGELDLARKVTLTRDDLAVFYQPIRKEILRSGSLTTDVADLIERAITQSDNTANDALLNIVGGPDAVRQTIVDKGLGQIRFGPGERAMQSQIAGVEWRQSYAYTQKGFFDARDQVPDSVRRAAFERYLSNPVDGATPLAIARALAKLTRGELLSETATAYFLTTLERTKSGPRRIKAGAPDGWRVAHKTGTGQFFEGRQSGYNDVGLITAPDGSSYAIAVMIGETRKPTPERMALMQAATRAVAEYHDAISNAQSDADASSGT